MLADTQKAKTEESKELRLALGQWLKALRESQNMSQREMADALSLEYYTFISQLENGRGRIPTHRYSDWAEVLGQNPHDFVKMLLSYYEPSTYAILFENKAS